MKYKKLLTQLGRAITTAFCIAGLASPSSLLACAGSSGLVCVVNPAACVKSMVLGKAVPVVVVLPLPGAPATTLAVPITLFITCPLTNNCGNPCPGAGGPVSASLAVGLYPGPCPAPPPPLPPPALSGAISTATATMALPTCAPLGPGFNAYVVPVTIPAGTPPGIYCVVGTATVTFPGGMVLTQTGDTTVCLVEPVPGRPGVPRLSLELISTPVPRMAPGDQALARYRITNNDPSNSVALTAFGTSRQSAVRPQGGNEAQGVFAISSPFGDDFPILFEPGTNCIPLPPHPYTQPEISRPLPTLRPGQTTNISLGIRSYGACASGSCSESTVRLAGAFSDGRPALACAGTSLFVDTSLPSQNWGRDVNDCNHNGIPDALDIEARRSADQNYNAMPDECEQLISIPYFANVAPNNPLAGAPIQVTVAINETVPMINVWANGSPLVRTQQFGVPFWVGTIPADTRPGPQTVYFLGKDVLGGMATYIALYQVRPGTTVNPRLSIQQRGSNVVVSWPVQSDAAFVLQKSRSLGSPTIWETETRTPSVVGNQYVLNYSPTASGEFFRLFVPVAVGGGANIEDHDCLNDTFYTVYEVAAGAPPTITLTGHGKNSNGNSDCTVGFRYFWTEGGVEKFITRFAEPGFSTPGVTGPFTKVLAYCFGSDSGPCRISASW